MSGCSAAALPCDVEVAPANLKDAQVFRDQLAGSIPKQTQVLFGDGGFDNQNCYNLCDQRGVSLVAPIKAKTNTPADRLQRIALYNDSQVRQAFTLRKTTVEPFQGRLKALFELEYLYMKGLKNVRALVIFATFAYLLLAKLNHRLGLDILKLQDTSCYQVNLAHPFIHAKLGRRHHKTLVRRELEVMENLLKQEAVEVTAINQLYYADITLIPTQEGWLYSFWSIRASVCRKIAAHNLAWFLTH